MENCEYYQMMLSELHDEKKDLPIELEEHLINCSACKEFQNTLQKQSNQLQDLPKLEIQFEYKQSIISKFWTTKLSIPLPAAAAVFLFMFGTYWLINNNTQEQDRIIEVEQKQTDYHNVQFVKFSPQTAVLVEAHKK